MKLSTSLGWQLYAYDVIRGWYQCEWTEWWWNNICGTDALFKNTPKYIAGLVYLSSESIDKIYFGKPANDDGKQKIACTKRLIQHSRKFTIVPDSNWEIYQSEWASLMCLYLLLKTKYFIFRSEEIQSSCIKHLKKNFKKTLKTSDIYRGKPDRPLT